MCVFVFVCPGNSQGHQAGVAERARARGEHFTKTKERYDDGQTVAGAGGETAGERPHRHTHTHTHSCQVL